MGGILGFFSKIGRQVSGAEASKRKMEHAKYRADQEMNQLNSYRNQASTLETQLKKIVGSFKDLDKERLGTERGLEKIQISHKDKLKEFKHSRGFLEHLERDFEKDKAMFEEKATTLTARHEGLSKRGLELEKKRAPLEDALKEITEETKKIEESGLGTKIKSIADTFNEKVKGIEQNKEKLKGISSSDYPVFFKQHKKSVEELATLRKKTETELKSKHAELEGSHKGVAEKLSRIIKEYQTVESEEQRLLDEQWKLEAKTKGLEHTTKTMAAHLENIQKNQQKFEEDQEQHAKALPELVKPFHETLKSLEEKYTAKRKEAEETEGKLKGLEPYMTGSINRIRGEHDIIKRASEQYSSRAPLGNIISGALMGLATYGIGSGVGAVAGSMGASSGMLSGISTLTSFGSKLAGLTGGLSAMQHTQKDLKGIGDWQERQDIELQEFQQALLPDWDKTPLNAIEFKKRVFDTKVSMPEFGGLKQSIMHFGMPTLPKLPDLPSLGDALGRIRSAEDIKNLGILPGNTANTMKKSLLNPNMFNTLTALMKSKGKEVRKKTGMGGNIRDVIASMNANQQRVPAYAS